ncbi:MAG: CoB--CoM heterodisulfide reductase iron-sulfur subunit B family protein [Lentisphaerae bacterium]|nr:CoB--CoM heterodisulfide reductase iron-sulfur subunit B family protein [Lentisphaerota bacterium]
MTAKYAYYPGCSLHSTAVEYDASFKAVAAKLDIELEEVPGWVCCGTSPAHSTSHLLSIALPIKNLALAEAAKATQMVVPCAACYSRFKFALYDMHHDQKIGDEVKEIVGSSFQGNIKVLHPLEVIAKLPAAVLKENVKRQIDDLKVVCYYGCLLTRPPKVVRFVAGGQTPPEAGDDVEYPTTMDKILENVGINVLDWSYKTDCCGGAFALSETDAVLTLTQRILKNALEVGADAIVVACPLCHANPDTRQAEINAKYNTNYNMPIYYFTQLMGLAFGYSPEEMLINKHLTEPALLRNVGKEQSRMSW